MNVSPSPPQKKVLYAITKAFWGGAQRYVYDLAVAAEDAGYDVTVAYGEPGPLANRLAEAGIATVPMPALARDVSVKNDVRAFFAFMRFVRDLKPDVIHLNSSKAVALGAIAARMAGVPRVIHTSHGWAFNEARPWWQRLVILGIHAVSIWLCPITICVSEAIRKDMLWLPFARRRLITIHNGISCPDLLSLKAARSALMPAEADATWVGMLCELHPTKRIEDAIDALRILRDESPSLRLVVIGEGTHRLALETYIHERGMEDRVFLAGFVPDAQSYLAAFDLFLHTSRSEALGYALLEAGCASLPCIATRVGGIPEIILDQKTGLLIPPYDPAAAATALRQLLADPSLATELGSALHAHVQTEFSREQMTERTFALY